MKSISISIKKADMSSINYPVKDKIQFITKEGDDIVFERTILEDAMRGYLVEVVSLTYHDEKA